MRLIHELFEILGLKLQALNKQDVLIKPNIREGRTALQLNMLSMVQLIKLSLLILICDYFGMQATLDF